MPGATDTQVPAPSDTPLPTATSAPEPTATTAATAEPDAVLGGQLWPEVVCSGCHGDQAQGDFGPKLAGTGLSLEQVRAAVRLGKGSMPALGEDRISDEDIGRARIGGATDAMDNLITLFALKVARLSGDIGDVDLAAVRHEGLDDGLVVEIIANVAINVMTNYLNKVAGTEIDFPIVELQTAA